MKARKLLVAAIPAATFLLAACGGGGGGSDSSTSTSQTTTISSSSDGGRAASSGVTSGSLAVNSTTSLSNLAAGTANVPTMRGARSLINKNPRLAKLNAAQAKVMQGPNQRLASALKRSKSMARSTRATVTVTPNTYNCVDFGQVTESGSYDNETFSFNFTYTYANCREYGMEWNGTMSMTGTDSTTYDPGSQTVSGSMTFTVTFGNNDGAVNGSDFVAKAYSGTGYTTLLGTMTAGLSMGGSFNFGTGATTFTANGGEQYVEGNDSFSLTFTNLAVTFTETVSPASGYWSGTETINGGIAETWSSTTWGSGSVGISYTNMSVAWAEISSTEDQWSVNGLVSTNFTPDDACYEGTFSFVTTTPVIENWMTGVTSAGVIVINGNTTVTFNADGTISVQVAGQAAVPYDSLSDLENSCPVSAMGTMES